MTHCEAAKVTEKFGGSVEWFPVPDAMGRDLELQRRLCSAPRPSTTRCSRRPSYSGYDAGVPLSVGAGLRGGAGLEGGLRGVLKSFDTEKVRDALAGSDHEDLLRQHQVLGCRQQCRPSRWCCGRSRTESLQRRSALRKWASHKVSHWPRQPTVGVSHGARPRISLDPLPPWPHGEGGGFGFGSYPGGSKHA